MKPARIFLIAIGLLIIASLTALDALRIAMHSPLRAALVASICAMLVYWIGPKFLRGTTR